MTKTQCTTAEEVIFDATLQAIASGRSIAQRWPDTPIEDGKGFDRQLSGTLGRLLQGSVFAAEDELHLHMMLDAIRFTLDGYRSGYGAYFLREDTSNDPLFDADAEAARRLGEELKRFLRKRQYVIDAVRAEREVAALRTKLQ